MQRDVFTTSLQKKVEELQTRMAELAVERAELERNAARSLAEEAASKAELAALLTAHAKRQIELDKFPVTVFEPKKGS